MRISKFSTLCVLCLMVGTALASDVDQVHALLKQKQYSQALAASTLLFDKNPEDPAIRFGHALALTQNEDYTRAAALFKTLIRDFPSMPEPYNNLAVIYAYMEQYSDAEEMLQAVLRINPEHATAKENLALLSKYRMPAVVEAKVDAATSAMKEPSKVVVTKVTKGLALKNESSLQEAHSNVETSAVNEASMLALKPSVTLNTKKANKPKPELVLSTQSEFEKQLWAKTEPGVYLPDRDSVTVNPRENNPANEQIRRDVFESLKGWATAWASKDTDAYFAMYSNDFTPPNAKTRSEWEARRKIRIMNKDNIRIQALDLVMEVGSPFAVVVTFQQIYRSNVLHEVSNKMLVFIRDSETSTDWKIVDERTSY